MRWFERKGARQSWLVAATTLLLLSGESLAQTTWPAPVKQLLPYVEAEGEPAQYSKFLWVSPTQLLFATSNPTLQFPDKSGDITVWHDDKNYKIWLFDIETKKPVSITRECYSTMKMEY